METDHANDPLSPYHIPQNDRGFFLIEELKGPNYATWSEALISVLESRNKFVFLDGTIKKPDSTDKLFPTWKRCNDFVLSGARATISSLIRESIEDITDASVLWQELKDKYSHGKFARIYQLRSDLFSLKQGDSSVSSYRTKLTNLLDELALFQPLSRCRSTNFSICNAYEIAIEHRTSDYTLYFLQGLNDNYAAIRSEILSVDPIPVLDEAFSRIEDEERKQLSIKVLTNPTVLSQLLQSNPATTSHTSNLVTTDNIITSSSISGRVKFLDFSSIVTRKSKEELKADPLTNTSLKADSDKCYNFTLGPSFKDESSNKYFTLWYEFKPQSADSAKPGLLCNTEEKSVSVESQNKQIGKSKVTFEETSEECKESDAVLFFDGETLRLELLDRAVEQLRHIQKPGESSTAAAATVADSSPIAKSRKLEPFSSARSSFETAPVNVERIDSGQLENAAIKADSSSEPFTGASPAAKNDVEEHQDDEMDKGTNAAESSETR